jgi:hypothetical protein
MIIFSLPYLFDFICGIYAMTMMLKIAKFNKIILERKNMEEAANLLYAIEVILNNFNHITLLSIGLEKNKRKI